MNPRKTRVFLGKPALFLGFNAKKLGFTLGFLWVSDHPEEAKGAWVFLRFARRVRGAVRVGVFGTSVPSTTSVTQHG
jgi:hypothetical protein